MFFYVFYLQINVFNIYAMHHVVTVSDWVVSNLLVKHERPGLCHNNINSTVTDYTDKELISVSQVAKNRTEWGKTTVKIDELC